jgi:uncharacterized protein with HEPN domain
MPQRDVRMYLSDILQSAQRIQVLTHSKTLEQYGADENLRLIVERSFEIIGEALRQAIAVEPSLEKSIANSRRIVNFRNLLIHAYHLIDHAIVWDIVESYLPAMTREVEHELAKRLTGGP